MGSDRSKHSKYSFRRLPSQKRAIPLYGERDDQNKYFRCWNCGFVCDSERDRLHSGDSQANTVVPTSFTDTGGATLYYPNVTGACPFCGAQYR